MCHALTCVLIPLCRWPPHINLLYPFYEDTGNAFQECTEAAAQALSTLQPFEVGFTHSIFREPRNAHCASLERSYRIMPCRPRSLISTKALSVRWQWNLTQASIHCAGESVGGALV